MCNITSNQRNANQNNKPSFLCPWSWQKFQTKGSHNCSRRMFLTVERKQVVKPYMQWYKFVHVHTHTHTHTVYKGHSNIYQNVNVAMCRWSDYRWFKNNFNASLKKGLTIFLFLSEKCALHSKYLGSN